MSKILLFGHKQLSLGVDCLLITSITLLAYDAFVSSIDLYITSNGFCHKSWQRHNCLRIPRCSSKAFPTLHDNQGQEDSPAFAPAACAKWGRKTLFWSCSKSGTSALDLTHFFIFHFIYLNNTFKIGQKSPNLAQNKGIEIAKKVQIATLCYVSLS